MSYLQISLSLVSGMVSQQQHEDEIHWVYSQWLKAQMAADCKLELFTLN